VISIDFRYIGLVVSGIMTGMIVVCMTLTIDYIWNRMDIYFVLIVDDLLTNLLALHMPCIIQVPE
jgi:hypothetical protein